MGHIWNTFGKRHTFGTHMGGKRTHLGYIRDVGCVVIFPLSNKNFFYLVIIILLFRDTFGTHLGKKRVLTSLWVPEYLPLFLLSVRWHLNTGLRSRPRPPPPPSFVKLLVFPPEPTYMRGLCARSREFVRSFVRPLNGLLAFLARILRCCGFVLLLLLPVAFEHRRRR